MIGLLTLLKSYGLSAPWFIYNSGPVSDLTLLTRSGQPFNGTQADFFAEHKTITGLKHRITGRVLLINDYGEIAGRGKE